MLQGKKVKETYELMFNSENKNKIVDNRVNIENVIKKKYESEIGSDEVGVGDYFGGVAACAVLIKKDDLNKLKKIGIQDSKNLNNAQIIEIAKKLKENKIKHEISLINPEEYNILFQKYKNSHIIKTYLHNKAIGNLIKKQNIDLTSCLIVMDQFANKKNYQKYLNVIKSSTKIEIDIFETQGESKYLSIAAASILARYEWLNSIYELEKKINHKIYLGASNPNVLKLARFIYQKKGVDELKKYVKLHFSFTKKIVNQI